MSFPSDMQKFMDDVIDNFYAGYAHLLACHIKDEGLRLQSITLRRRLFQFVI